MRLLELLLGIVEGVERMNELGNHHRVFLAALP